MNKALNFVHQEKLFDPRYARPVTVMGAGSQGSVIVPAIARMGAHDITVWDDDGITSDNIPYSGYRPRDVGRYKVDALAEIVREETGVEIKAWREKYAGEPLRNTTVICSPDTMAARRLVWEKVKNNPTVDLFVDTRTKAWYLEVYPIIPYDRADIEYYEALLFDDADAAHHFCGEHGHIAVALAGAAIVTATLSTFWQHGTKKLPIRLRCDSLVAV